jgi:hypothetical protein
MKKYIFLTSLLLFILTKQGFSQEHNYEQVCSIGVPWIELKNGVVYWCEQKRNNNWLDQFSLIFEGHILADHKILVIKQFKGVFNSDTLTNLDRFPGVAMQRDAFANTGDEAIFFVTVNASGDILYALEGDNKGFLKVCDKPDVAKEVYESLEKVIGHPYIEVHPNTCATQKQKK